MKKIAAVIISGAAILGCLVLFISVTRSRELEEREGDNTTAFPSVFRKANVLATTILS